MQLRASLLSTLALLISACGGGGGFPPDAGSSTGGNGSEGTLSEGDTCATDEQCERLRSNYSLRCLENICVRPGERGDPCATDDECVFYCNETAMQCSIQAELGE